MERARDLFHQLNHDYLKVHRAKEKLFWATYMATSDDHPGFARAEQAFQGFISDPERLAQVRAELARLEKLPDGEERRALQHGLRGWQALFECNVVQHDDARACMRELIDMEAELFAKRRDYTMTHLNEQGVREEASLSSLLVDLATHPDEAARRGSHDTLLELERWVLGHGLLEIVRQRNWLARSLGHHDYFEYKVRKNERLGAEELFALLGDFEARTREANARSLARLATEKGPSALQAHNLRYYTTGDINRQLDPYLPFARALERWAVSFRRLGITYRGAQLQLDLLERKGKHQNGFCHAPVPCFFDAGGRWVAGHINFTSDAKPDQVGSGARALETLFHEGGHAAHFANVTQSSPCFSQEFPPTSMAYAETQSMFCDSLLEDADWLARYAVDTSGRPVPEALLRARIEATQPFRAHAARTILAVPYFEQPLYRMDDADLKPEAVLALARRCEQQILGIPVAPRPLLALPHLLNQESAASYHGYLMAKMAVHQTRAHLMRRLGFLTDNPAVGPLLARHYWGPGNSATHQETLMSLTGEGLSARYLAEVCNRTVEDAWQEARQLLEAAASRRYPEEYPPSLDATVRVVHGTELIADNQESDPAMCRRFAEWVERHYPKNTASSP